jgi:hypothetical protein
MRNNTSYILTCSLSLLALMIGQPVKAERVCQVTDPTGTPLNVRDRPNGRIINALRNGREVYIHKTIDLLRESSGGKLRVKNGSNQVEAKSKALASITVTFGQDAEDL